MIFFALAVVWASTALLTAFAFMQLHSGWVLLLMLLPACVEMHTGKCECNHKKEHEHD